MSFYACPEYLDQEMCLEKLVEQMKINWSTTSCLYSFIQERVLGFLNISAHVPDVENKQNNIPAPRDRRDEYWGYKGQKEK